MLPIMHTKVLQLTTKEVRCVAIVRRAVSIFLNCLVKTMQLEEKFAAGTKGKSNHKVPWCPKDCKAVLVLLFKCKQRTYQFCWLGVLDRLCCWLCLFLAHCSIIAKGLGRL